MEELKQRRAPLVEAMLAYVQSGAFPFHTPGHKRGDGAHELLKKFITSEGLAAEVSISEVLDDPYEPRTCIKEAQELAAELFGADETIFCVNGTTGAIHAMMLACVNEGEKIILPRNVHRSVVSALVLTGAVPVYLEPVFSESIGITMGVTLQSVKDAVKNNPDAKALLAVYPTYYGVTNELKEIAEFLHEQGKLLLVDEAHGAHLKFSDELPDCASDCGADIVAQSTHKLLGSLTQTSMLHVNTKRIDFERVKKAHALVSSTSPDYLLFASLDIARMQMATSGEELNAALKIARECRERINITEGLYSFTKADLGKSGMTGLDELKLTVDVTGLGMTGAEAAKILREDEQIEAELFDEARVLFLFTYADKAESGEKLLSALNNLTKRKTKTSLKKAKYVAPPKAELVLSPREAFFANVTRVNFAEAGGKISAETISFYPPGIPVICAGERLSKDVISYMSEMKEKGLMVSGASDATLNTINVIRREGR